MNAARNMNNEKTLCNMPVDVHMSALCVRPGFIGGCFRAADAVVNNLLAYAVRFAPLLVLAWVVMLLPFDSFDAAVPKARMWSSIVLAALFIACVAYRIVFELGGSVPRKDRDYPLIATWTMIPGLLFRRSCSIYPLSWVAFAYAALLWLSWWRGWQPIPTSWHTLSYAVLNTGIGAAAYAYGRFLPWHGYRKPTDEDLSERARRRASAAAPQPQQQAAAAVAEYGTPVNARGARLAFSGIHGMADLKQRLFTAATQILQTRQPGQEAPRNGILLHGEPGNGKTIFAEALAGELGIPIVGLTYGDISAKWLGEMPRVISNCFAYAKQHAPCVFFIDEVDSFLRSRDGNLAGDNLKIANTMLTEIVTLRDYPVVLVAATNYLGTLDAAAIREGRFDFKVEVTAPDEEARIGLLEEGVSRHMRGTPVDRDAMRSVARRWSGFSVSRLLAVVKAMPECVSGSGARQIGFPEWMAALRTVQGRKGQVRASAKRLSDLILDAETSEALALIARRLRDVHRVEALGGTLPGGVLLHGPSGTGKTVAAQALALESGWAFLSVPGPDLIADRERIKKIYMEACDLRPTLIFIDEADDVLRDRQISGTPDAVNRLLEVMDGTSGRVADVVFMAATNHPEQVDPALLRAGRFTEKVAFYLPTEDDSAQAIALWLKRKQVRLELSLDEHEVAKEVGERSIADLEGILQYTLNCAITRGTLCIRPVIYREDVDAALRVVGCGQ